MTQGHVDGNRTPDLESWKRPLNQLSHNHCPCCQSLPKMHSHHRKKDSLQLRFDSIRTKINFEKVWWNLDEQLRGGDLIEIFSLKKKNFSQKWWRVFLFASLSRLLCLCCGCLVQAKIFSAEPMDKRYLNTLRARANVRDWIVHPILSIIIVVKESQIR